MDRLHVFIILLVEATASCQAHTFGSVVNLTVNPGDNVTLYCDCQRSTGIYIVWYRNCSHVNQPMLVMQTRYRAEKTEINFSHEDSLHPFPRFHLVNNDSSQSYDLLIMNITDSDEGLYYCGTQTSSTKGDGKNYIPDGYGSVTRMILSCKYPVECRQHETPQTCGLCWMLLYSLCPAFAVLSSLLSSGLVYHFCKKTAKEPEVHEKESKSSDRTRGNQDEDVCYAALEIRQPTQRSKKKKTQSSDFSTYSAINTHRT